MTPPPPLAPDQVLILLVQLAALLTLAIGLGRLAGRLNLPPVAGELLAGVLLGPSLLGQLSPSVQHWLFPADAAQANLLDAIGLLGVLLLVGVAGAHVDLGLARRRMAVAASVSIGGLVVPLGLGIGVAYLAPASLLPAQHDRLVFALFFGVAMAVSAIPVIAKTLADMRLLHRDVGQLTLIAGMVNDIVAWFLLSVVSAMATVGLAAGPLARSVAFLVGFVVLAAVLGRPLVRHAMRLAARSADPAPSIATAVVIVLCGAAASHAIGLEPVFGGFVAGILLGSRRLVDPARLAPLRTVVLGVLAPIFLATAGLRMDLSVLGDPGILLATVVVLVVAIVGKFVGAYLGARVGKLGHWEGLAIGAGLNARGAVELIVALVGLRLGVLDVAAYTVIALVAVVTSLMAPPVLRVAMAHISQNAEERLRQSDQRDWTDPAPARTT
ncbi:cation:proton antiporter [Actinophytocola sediminis]